MKSNLEILVNIILFKINHSQQNKMHIYESYLEKNVKMITNMEGIKTELDDKSGRPFCC